MEKTDTRGPKLADFDYDLPPDRIALYPVTPRDSCKLLVVERSTGRVIADTVFRDISEYIDKGSLLILNDSKVLKARIYMKKPSGGTVELLIVKITGDDSAVCLINRARLKRHRKLFSGDVTADILEMNADGTSLVKFSTGIDKLMGSEGVMPIPPYIKRAEEKGDEEWYQNVYANNPGSIASATAGLHFTEGVLSALKSKGVIVKCITLHISMDTFRPVREDDLSKKCLQGEYYVLGSDVVSEIGRAKKEGSKVICCGTSVVRAMESWATTGRATGIADIFIRLGFKFQMADRFITNFHQPRSFPFILTSSFSGADTVKRWYKRALENNYRFLSYGDCMFIV